MHNVPLPYEAHIVVEHLNIRLVNNVQCEISVDTKFKHQRCVPEFEAIEKQCDVDDELLKQKKTDNKNRLLFIGNSGFAGSSVFMMNNF